MQTILFLHDNSMPLCYYSGQAHIRGKKQRFKAFSISTAPKNGKRDLDPGQHLTTRKIKFAISWPR